MDEADRADSLQESALVEALYRMRKAAETLHPTGECLWCGEIVGDYHRWCDADCRDMWERDRARRP